MKASRFLHIAVLALPLILGSCHSKKPVVEEPKPQTQEEIEHRQFVERVANDTVPKKFITSKLKFTVEVGPQKISLTGNLKMKRDDVIRLQLMAFGFVEAGRIEFTKDYVLIMDRINKQYLKAPYIQVEFLRTSGLNFNSLQALFWNELFMPGRTEIKKDDLAKYETTTSGDDIVISLEDSKKLFYSWLASENTGVIKMANILYKDRLNGGNSQLNWDYQAFQPIENSTKMFPSDMRISLTTPQKEVKLAMKLNYIGHETDWDFRTEVSSKYREVTVDEILRRFMAL